MKLYQKILLILVILFAVFAIVGLSVYNRNYDRIAYQISNYEEKRQLEVIHISREKGHEPIYTVDVHADDEIEVPESIYNEFLKGYNTVTVRMEELSVYAAEYKFGTSFQKSKGRHFVRRSYPWDDVPSVFSDAEIKEAADAMKKYAHPLENDTYENLSVSFPYNYQMHGGGDQCLSDGAVEYIFEKS